MRFNLFLGAVLLVVASAIALEDPTKVTSKHIPADQAPVPAPVDDSQDGVPEFHQHLADETAADQARQRAAAQEATDAADAVQVDNPFNEDGTLKHGDFQVTDVSPDAKAAETEFIEVKGEYTPIAGKGGTLKTSTDPAPKDDSQDGVPAYHKKLKDATAADEKRQRAAVAAAKAKAAAVKKTMDKDDPFNKDGTLKGDTSTITDVSPKSALLQKDSKTWGKQRKKKGSRVMTKGEVPSRNKAPRDNSQDGTYFADLKGETAAYRKKQREAANAALSKADAVKVHDPFNKDGTLKGDTSKITDVSPKSEELVQWGPSVPAPLDPVAFPKDESSTLGHQKPVRAPRDDSGDGTAAWTADLDEKVALDRKRQRAAAKEATDAADAVFVHDPFKEDGTLKRGDFEVTSVAPPAEELVQVKPVDGQTAPLKTNIVAGQARAGGHDFAIPSSAPRDDSADSLPSYTAGLKAGTAADQKRQRAAANAALSKADAVKVHDPFNKDGTLKGDTSKITDVSPP